MIISRTPFRISFSGGGTDFREFYERTEGSVLTTAIDKYMYITINKRFDDTIRISYSQTEIVKRIEDIQHKIVRETLKLLKFKGGLEIVSIADIPAQSGLGSSSSFTVGLLNALHAFRGEQISATRLAQMACHIEIDLCKEPIGKQDQYIAAFGGLRQIRFERDGNVFVDYVVCPAQVKTKLMNNLLMFYTKKTRKASSVLNEQKRKIPAKLKLLTSLRDYSFEMRDILLKGKNLSEFGEILHASWELKKKLTSAISNGPINSVYERARKAGAVGGKILGAGGGGFLLLYVNQPDQPAVRRALHDMPEVPIQFEPQGSRIIYVGN